MTSSEPDQPTVKPADNFNVDEDCESLKKAMKGLGTDEEELINILCKRSWEQRAKIEEKFKEKFEKDLESELSDETSGNFKKVLARLMKTPVELTAFELNEAISGAGTDEDCLVEVICTKSSKELREIEAKYKEMFNKDLEQEILGDTSGYFQRLLVSLLKVDRPTDDAKAAVVLMPEDKKKEKEEEEDKDDDKKGDKKKKKKNPFASCFGKKEKKQKVVSWSANDDAKKMNEACTNKEIDEEKLFTEILGSRSYKQLREVFEAFSKEYNKDVREVIEEEMSGDIAKGLKAVIGAMQNKNAYFANQLQDAVAGAGTKDVMLLRIIIGHCDFDLGNIKAEYEKIYGKSLSSVVKDETSGDYKRSLLAIIGDE